MIIIRGPKLNSFHSFHRYPLRLHGLILSKWVHDHIAAFGGDPLKVMIDSRLCWMIIRGDSFHRSHCLVRAQAL